MAKISKPAIISLSILGFLILTTIIMLIPIGGRTLLAKAFDGVGNHKAAFGTDLFFQGKANGLLQNLSVNDLSQTDQCQNAYKILKNEKLNFLMPISGQNKLTIKPSSNDKVLLETKFGGIINPTTRKASANLEMMTKIDQNSAKDIIDELAGSGISVGTFVPNEVKTQISGFFDINSILFTVNKFDLKTSDINSSNGLSNYYNFDLKNQDAAIEKTRQEGLDEVFGELKNLANIKINEVLEENTFNQIAQSTCSGVKSMKVEAPSEVDFEGTKKLVRPVITEYKENILELQLGEQNKLMTVLQKDKKFQDFLIGKYQSYVKLGNGFNKIIPPTDDQKEAFKPLTEEEYKAKIAEGFAADRSKEMEAQMTKDKENFEQMKEYYNFMFAPSTTFIDANTGDIYGSQSGGSLVFSDKTKQSFSPKVRDLLGDSLSILSSSWNIQYGDAVKDLDLPTNTKPASDFAKDLGNTDAAKKIQNETQKMNESRNYETGGIEFSNPDQNQITSNNSQGMNSTFGNSNSMLNSRGNFGNSVPSATNRNPSFNSSTPAFSDSPDSSSMQTDQGTFGGTDPSDPMPGTNDALNMGN